MTTRFPACALQPQPICQTPLEGIAFSGGLLAGLHHLLAALRTAIKRIPVCNHTQPVKTSLEIELR